jgi:Retrotransposon gag protein/Zinc knuckle
MDPTEMNQDSQVSQEQEPSFDIARLLSTVVDLQAQVLLLQQPRASSAPKPVKPPLYSGKISQPVDTWLFQMEQYFLATAVEPQRRIPFAASFLTDNAAIWWRHMFQKMAQTTVTWSWENFKSNLRQQFRPVDAERLARDRLYKLRQVTSVATYVHEFQSIVIDIPTMSEEDQLDRFLRGLKLDIHKWVAMQRPTTLADACSLATTIDSISYQTRISTPAPSFRSSAFTPIEPHPTASVEPMEINTVHRAQLTDTERSALRRTGGCFYCRKVGHIARNCPRRPA